MKRKITWSALIFTTLIIVGISCKKETLEPPKAELIITFDADSIKSYSITGCDNIEIDSVKGNEYTHLIISGCGNTFRDSVLAYTPDWHYNCYPVYDYWGYYLYDDCYWEYY